MLCIAAGEYERDINTVNPLGMKGALATAFAQMISALWSGTYQSYQPTKIKVHFRYLHMLEFYQQKSCIWDIVSCHFAIEVMYCHQLW